MKKLKINQNNSLKRVLSIDEMKSILGGSSSTITCECTLIFQKGTVHENSRKDDPIGDFYTPALCTKACNRRCKQTVGCDEAKAHYNMSASGSYGS